MSIEDYLESTKKKPRAFKDVAGKLLAEREPNDPRPWKWEEEIGTKEWERIEKPLNSLIDLNIWTSFAKEISLMRTLDPDHIYHIPASAWDKMLEKLSTYKQNKKWWEFAELASHLSLLDASRVAPLLDNDTLLKIKEDFEKKLQQDRTRNLWMLEDYAYCIFLLDPSCTPSSNEYLWRKIDSQLAKYKTGGKWGKCIIFASQLRLMNPARALPIDSSMWNEMKKEINTILSGDSGDLVGIASGLRILAAHKVEVTKDGIIIIDKSPATLDVDIPPRPLRKKI